MKRLVRITALALVLLAVGLWLVKIREKKAYFSDAGDVFFYTLFLFDDATTFSTGFSEAKFKAIERGQSMQEVHLIVGEPISKGTNQVTHEEYWRYSQAPPDRNYWFRVVVFGQDGRVKEIDRHYFVD